jgi:Predicted aminoglycoside phosphotransferase
MRYYYFNPYSRQFYFPEGFEKHQLFSRLYKPYLCCAKILWGIWLNSRPFRSLFSTNHPENRLPINEIGKYAPPGSIMAFNLGTPGIEQKITVLGISPTSGETFFFKYATSSIARNNVSNEAAILQQLSHLSIIPELQLHINGANKYTLIKTKVLEGVKMEYIPVNDQILSILLVLADQSVLCNRKYESELRTCFAHGDFCSWNMLIHNGEIKVCDWEMAGLYPLGYDLFTNIFQTSFELNSEVQISKLLQINFSIIQQYFQHFKINNWMPYLLEFANLKLQFEEKKEKSTLVQPFLELKKYCIEQKDSKHIDISSSKKNQKPKKKYSSISRDISSLTGLF